MVAEADLSAVIKISHLESDKNTTQGKIHVSFAFLRLTEAD